MRPRADSLGVADDSFILATLVKTAAAGNAETVGQTDRRKRRAINFYHYVKRAEGRTGSRKRRVFVSNSQASRSHFC